MYQEWFELFNKIKEEGKKQCMEGGWESEYRKANRKTDRIIKKNK